MHTYKILIIDDDKSLLRIYERILCGRKTDEEASAFYRGTQAQTHEYDLILCESGEDAVEAVKDNKGEPISMAFVDMRMPGLNGAETVREIRAIDRDIEVVFVTAFTDIPPDQIIEMMGVSFFYLKKPFDADEIRQFAVSLCPISKKNREWDEALRIIEKRGRHDE